MDSVASWKELFQLDTRIRFHVVLDGGNPDPLYQGIPPFVQVDVVPAAYTPQSAAYKARVLEYFRTNYDLHDDAWVLHLDEETQLDVCAVKTVLNFIERGDRQIGMV